MIWWVMGAIAGPAGLALLAWAMLWDRSRGRLRCPKCWYAMEGAPSGDDGKRLCPECGRRSAERELRRTRRRWRWAGVAVAVLVGAVLAVQPKVRQDGWIGLAPTRALIELAPIGGVEGEMRRELMRRMGIASRRDGSMRASMTPSQQLALLRRLRHGNWLSRPGDKRWDRSFGNITRFRSHAFVTDLTDPLATARFLDGSPATEDLQAAIAALFETPATLHVRTREMWPRGVRPLIETRVQHWWLAPAYDEVDIRWAAGDESGKTNARGHFNLPVLEGSGEVAVALDVDVLQKIRTPTPTERVVFTESHALTYRLVDTLEEILNPLQSSAVDQWLAGSLKPEINAQQIFSIAPPWPSGCPVDVSDVGFAMQVEIFESGEYVAARRVRWLGEFDGGVTFSGGGGDEPWTALRDALQDRSGSGKWTVRLRPDPEQALYLLDAERYWVGDIELPLAVNWAPAP